MTDGQIYLMATFPGQPGWAGTRKVKPICFLTKQEMMVWQWHQLDHANYLHLAPGR